MRACAIAFSLLLPISAAVAYGDDAPTKAKVAASTKARAKQTDSATKEKAKAAPSAAQRELATPAADIDFDAVALSEALDVLRGLCKANVFLDPRGLEAAGVKPDAPVTVAKDEKATVKSVLTKVLADAGKEKRKAKLTFVTTGNVVVVSTAARAKALADNLRKDGHRGLSGADLAVLGTSLPEVKFEGVQLADVLSFIGDISKTPVEPNWKQLEIIGVKRDAIIDLHLRDVTIAQMLRLTLEAAGPTKPVAFVTINGRTQVSVLEGLLEGLEMMVEEFDNVAKAKASLKKQPK